VSKEVMSVRITILPKTPLGRWSVWLAAAIILLIVLGIVLGGLGVLDIPSGSVVLITVFPAVGISGIGSFVTGLISIIKSKERSILAFLAVVVMGLFTPIFWIFFIGEEVLG
jgi:hypothetical protein